MLRDDLRPWAARFEYLSMFQCLLQSDLLVYLGHRITPQMYSQIALKFPRFVPLLKKAVTRYKEQHREHGDIDHDEVEERFGIRFKLEHSFRFWEALTRGRLLPYGLMNASSDPLMTRWPDPSLKLKEAIAYSLRLVKQREEKRFAELINRVFPHWTGSQSPLELEDIWLKPWAMPEYSVLRRIGQLFEDGPAWQRIEDWHPGRRNSPSDPPEAEEPEAIWLFREKFRLSAAAVAIWFLERLPVQSRRHLRNVLLHEDHVSMHNPESHAHGFIPFCKDNPRLRIERRISLFGNAFHHVPQISRLTAMVEKTNDEGRSLRCLGISQNLSGWLLEALDAVDAGMPATSFTLALDGEPAIDTCSDIFQQVVHRDIAWEKVYRKRRAQGDFHPLGSRFELEFVKEGFTEAI
ncbi:hypothetical protein ACHAPT_012292 [Fusarium lateritium]